MRKVLKNCFKCKQLWKSSSEQKMADLPEDRVTPGKPPFSYIGVDCFGPFMVKGADRLSRGMEFVHMFIDLCCPYRSGAYLGY